MKLTELSTSLKRGPVIKCNSLVVFGESNLKHSTTHTVSNRVYISAVTNAISEHPVDIAMFDICHVEEAIISVYLRQLHSFWSGN